MTNLIRDPKGYYVALGIGESADNDAIKAAYRTKAKRVHPDFNPSPVAAKQFHRLHEAYEILSDPEKRAAYDRPWRTENAKTSTHGAGTSWRAKPKPQPEPGRDTPKPRTEDVRPRPQPHTSAANAADQPEMCKCGKVTAQPRYVIFDLVLGRLNRVQRRGISGVFCRTCADRTAVRTSLANWLAGWWAWPDGPRETAKALINNIRGGRKPADHNARLLIRQANAFRARGEMELARSAAEQALAFATTRTLRREVDQLLVSLSAYPARALINRWAKPGWAPMVQVLPLALIVAALSMTVTMSGSVSMTNAVREFIADFGTPTSAPAPPTPSGDRLTPTGRVYSVVAAAASLRTGPGASYRLVAVLKQGTLVLVTEADPGGQWLRVTTGDGGAGFVATAQVSPDVRMDALRDVGGFAKPAPQVEVLPNDGAN